MKMYTLKGLPKATMGNTFFHHGGWTDTFVVMTRRKYMQYVIRFADVLRETNQISGKFSNYALFMAHDVIIFIGGFHAPKRVNVQ